MSTARPRHHTRLPLPFHGMAAWLYLHYSAASLAQHCVHNNQRAVKRRTTLRCAGYTHRSARGVVSVHLLVSPAVNRFTRDDTVTHEAIHAAAFLLWLEDHPLTPQEEERLCRAAGLLAARIHKLLRQYGIER